MKSENRAEELIESIPPVPGGFNLKYAVTLCAGAGLLLLSVWGFSVDDAWIVTRVARHGALFGQFDFNLGVQTDSVTPRGFAHLIGTWGRWWGLTEPPDFFRWARIGGAGAYLLSFFLAGGLVQGPFRWWCVPLVAGCLPASIWAGAGLATPWCGLFLLLGELNYRGLRHRLAAFLWGMAVAWRPELALLGGFLVLAPLRSEPRGTVVCRFDAKVPWPLQVLGAFCLPVLAIATWRWISFESWLPLSASAKAPSLQSGVFYGAISLVWGGLVLSACVAPRAFRHNGVGWCSIVHLVAVVFCGGDWMPALRLWAPVYPLLLLRFSDTLLVAEPRSRTSWMRWAIACLWAPLMPMWLLVQQGADFRAVTERRWALVQSGQRALEGAKNVAAVDIGWVGLATAATVTDLGGVTDPMIGRLRGGHTNRLISPGLFSDRNIDAWVIRLRDDSFVLGDDLGELHPVYQTDARLLRAGAAQDMKAVALLVIPGTPGQYVVLRQR